MPTQLLLLDTSNLLNIFPPNIYFSLDIEYNYLGFDDLPFSFWN